MAATTPRTSTQGREWSRRRAVPFRIERKRSSSACINVFMNTGAMLPHGTQDTQWLAEGGPNRQQAIGSERAGVAWAGAIDGGGAPMPQP